MYAAKVYLTSNTCEPTCKSGTKYKMWQYIALKSVPFIYNAGMPSRMLCDVALHESEIYNAKNRR